MFNPEADPGHLCAFAGPESIGTGALFLTAYDGNEGADRTGAYILLSGIGPTGFFTGSFATTGAP